MDRLTGGVVVVVVVVVVAVIAVIAVVVVAMGDMDNCWFFLMESRRGADRVDGCESDLVAMASEASTK